MRKLKLNKKKLRAEMDRQKLTYQNLGDLLHSSRQAVGHYYRYPGNLTLKTVSKIADALNIDPKDLLI